MKFLVVLFCFAFVVCSSLSLVSEHEKSIILRQKRDADETSHTRELLKELMKELQDSAHQAVEAVRNFNAGVKDEIKYYVDKIHTDINRLRRRISGAIRKVTEKILLDIEEGITTCIESHREEADALFEETYTRSRACADKSIKEVNDMIEALIAESNTALDYSKDVLESMRNCSIDDNGSILNVGQCLGPLTNEAQNVGVIFATNSGNSIARINMAIGMLPTAFEICAGFNIVRATVGTGKIIFDVGRCSVASIFT